MLEITDNETNSSVIEAVQKGKSLLMFYTDWCPLCPPIINILKKLEEEKNGKFNFAKINFDKNPISVSELGIKGVPMVLAIDNGKILEACGGLIDEEAYRKIIEQLFDEKFE